MADAVLLFAETQASQGPRVLEASGISGGHITGSVCGVRKGKWKLHSEIRGQNAGPWQLFDLDADISETNDLAAKHPEVVSELQQLLQQHREDVGDRLTNTQGKETRTLGVFRPGKRILKHE